MNLLNKHFLVSLFKEGNLIVFGKKRKGKDLIFNCVINARKKNCYSNIQFNPKFSQVKNILDFDIKNTYENFLNYDIKKLDRKDLPFEDNHDFYISDAGIYLPSQYNNILNKKYSSLPILYALSSQVFDFNIHVNTQGLTRPWDKLREQADYYIKALKTIKIGPFFITKFRVYDKYSSAVDDLRPYPSSLFMKSESKANRELYECKNGIIVEKFIIQRKKAIKYDTHAFRKILINDEPDTAVSSKE